MDGSKQAAEPRAASLATHSVGTRSPGTTSIDIDYSDITSAEDDELLLDIFADDNAPDRQNWRPIALTLTDADVERARRSSSWVRRLLGAPTEAPHQADLPEPRERRLSDADLSPLLF